MQVFKIIGLILIVNQELNKMKKLVLLFLAGTIVTASFAQSELKRTAHWRFGQKAGMDFDISNNYKMSVFPGSNGVVYEGNSCISDTAGNLLFYVNGDTIWNSMHQPMLNGTGMPSDKITLVNSCIIPRPGNSTQYFVFINECTNNNCTGGALKYSIVDMTLDGGKGAVVSGQKNIVVMKQAYNGITFTKHANGIDYWLSYAESNNPYNLCMIKTTNAGPDTTNRVISTFSGPISDQRFSPDGMMLEDGSYFLYKFNNATGVLSNQLRLNLDSCNSGYSCYYSEFSPDSKKLYTAGVQGSGYHNLIIQYDISVYDSAIIANNIFYIPDKANTSFPYGLGQIQLAPDGKIYIAKTGGFTDSLHVIHTPNAKGASCNFEYNAVGLGNPCNFSLSTFPDFYFNNITTGINELGRRKNLTFLFPNPSNDILNIRFDDLIYNQWIDIADVSGKIIHSENINGNTCKINVSAYSNGIYFIISKDNPYIKSKFIINH